MNRKPTDLIGIISECLDTCKIQAPSRNITLKTSERTLEVNIDPVRLYQVISNLLDNALKYTPESSPIEVTAEAESDWVRISVRDHGPGLTEQQQAELFNPFGRGADSKEERASGLGLGLLICRRIIELHGGRIGVKSKMDVGSVFFFELPRIATLRKVA